MLLALVLACSTPEATPVGVTMHDGQVLVGAITTETLRLDGGLGVLEVPLVDVGVVLPVEGTRLADANGHVTVWLRNGSELRGEWAEPELAVGLEMGGGTVHVDLPTGDLQAVQTRGTEIWPTDDVFRVRTTWGDDFLVDATRSRIAVTNELGRFAPFLSECRSAAPVGDMTGEWRLELTNGSVIVGEVQDGALAMVLPMGPDTVSVPLDRLVSMQREAWHGEPAAAPEQAAPALSSGEGWFDYRGLSSAKSRTGS